MFLVLQYGEPFAARAAGINVQRHLTSIYMFSGLMAGLTGMFFYLRLGSGAPTSGSGRSPSTSSDAR